ncbi:hypothetical protein J8G26_08955 [Acidovorax sp. JG5]|uniref:hypothetical protein n=1 Tax=Acidovorax sp. JG5 TaxID=2822718 RepID=UPI001B31F96E|nr:hypothetical protein [Acidovorax sp. JG5]MBP3980855.1 hypothetical protein [Acidovorax sp. JG5]
MHNSTPAAAATEHRLEALELFMQHLVLVIECQPTFSAEALDRWVHMCCDRMDATGSSAPATVNALRQLLRKVLS